MHKRVDRAGGWGGMWGAGGEKQSQSTLKTEKGIKT